MSLNELIFAQKGILLTIGLAVLLLMMAGVIAAIPYMQRFQAQRVVRREKARARAAARAVQQRLEEQQAQVEQADAIETIAPATTDTGSPSVDPAASSVSPSSSPSPVAATPSSSSAPTAAGGLTTALQTSQSASENKDAPASAMQDLLSSVFSDEEGQARRDALLKGLNPVDITGLLELCNRVVSQLQHSGNASK